MRVSDGAGALFVVFPATRSLAMFSTLLAAPDSARPMASPPNPAVSSLRWMPASSVISALVSAASR